MQELRNSLWCFKLSTFSNSRDEAEFDASNNWIIKRSKLAASVGHCKK